MVTTLPQMVLHGAPASEMHALLSMNYGSQLAATDTLRCEELGHTSLGLFENF